MTAVPARSADRRVASPAAARVGRRTAKECRVFLACGRTLTYETSNLMPRVGATVPCRRHDYCRVVAREVAGTRPSAASRTVRPTRSPAELAVFMECRPITTIAALRHERFTLRVVVAAQRDGLVDVDLIRGQVVLRPTTPPGDAVSAS